MTAVAEMPVVETRKEVLSEELPGAKLLPVEQRTDVTVDELEKMSLPCPAELYNGKVVYKMANYEHGLVQVNLITELKLYLRQTPIGDLVSETNFRIWPDRSDESRIPDIAFVRKERAPKDRRRFPDLTPDLAIEIVSPSDNFIKTLTKAEAYLDQGSQLVWLVVPETREVLVCTKDEKFSVRDLLTAPDLLPGFELPLKTIFEGVSLSS